MKPEEQGFLDAKSAADRLFATDDGKLIIEFLEHISGYERPIPRARLEIQEGARRMVCMLKTMLKLKPDHAVAFFKKEGGTFLS